MNGEHFRWIWCVSKQVWNMEMEGGMPLDLVLEVN